MPASPTAKQARASTPAIVPDLPSFPRTITGQIVGAIRPVRNQHAAYPDMNAESRAGNGPAASGARNEPPGSAVIRGVEPRTAAPAVENSVEELYSWVAPRLRRVAYLMVGRADVAEEIVHEAFVRTFHRLPSVDTPAAYLRTTVVNLCLSWRGRRALEQRHQPQGRAAVELPELDETWELLRRLPRRQRAAVVLRYYDDLPFYPTPAR